MPAADSAPPQWSLTACAFREAGSRGRRHLEPAHPYRGEFQRDRDRIIHARAFRRLENKTQVFSRRFSDHFRNRLTHTLEVAQISRTVAQALGLNQDLVEALALVHDIGHPPFGHAGERALDAAMHDHGGSFDHNLQALRIAEQFEVRYAAFRGLNLTFEVREGIVKHSHDYTAAEHPELTEYLLDQRPPVEAQLIDLTDEISYLSADLDDGFEARLLGLDQIAAAVPLFRRLLAQVDQRYTALNPKLRFNETLRLLINELVGGLIARTWESMQSLDSVAAVRAHPTRLAGFAPGLDGERLELRQFLYRELYNHPQLAVEHERAAATIQAVFAHYLAHPEALPPAHRAQLALAAPQQVICDYLAGMTDGFIASVHHELRL